MILDNYSLEKNIGKGAFGEVFLTTKKGTSKLFAAKQIDKEFFDNQTTKKYLLNEVYILKELNHPNIVHFETLKKTKQNIYIIMEYCNGGELSKALEDHIEKTGKPFSQEVVQHLMKQIISAFKYIHEKSIIHRDIKLQNILLNYDTNEDKKNKNLMKATIKIIDFGFAAMIDKAGLKYSTLGSPLYMDPLILKEVQKRGKKTNKLGYDQKADIWSLGTICYEMAIGQCAFDADKIDELIQKIEKGEYMIPTTLSQELISFINGMLQYDPKQRLTIEQLAKHSFLTMNQSQFHKLDLKKVNNNLVKSKLKMNVKANQSIWAIFNEEDENTLLNIGRENYAKEMPIAEEQNHQFKRLNTEKDIKNNNNNIINININVNKNFNRLNSGPARRNIDNNFTESIMPDSDVNNKIINKNNANDNNNNKVNNNQKMQNNNNRNINNNNAFQNNNNNKNNFGNNNNPNHQNNILNPYGNQQQNRMTLQNQNQNRQNNILNPYANQQQNRMTLQNQNQNRQNNILNPYGNQQQNRMTLQNQNQNKQNNILNPYGNQQNRIPIQYPNQQNQMPNNNYNQNPMINRGPIPNNNYNYGNIAQAHPGMVYGYQGANPQMGAYQQMQQNPFGYQNQNAYNINFF